MSDKEIMNITGLHPLSAEDLKVLGIEEATISEATSGTNITSSIVPADLSGVSLTPINSEFVTGLSVITDISSVGDEYGITISEHGRQLVNAPPMVVNKGIDCTNLKPLLSQPTNFEMCAEINMLVGNIPSRTQEVIEHQKKIIEGEWEEMCEHVASGDIHKLRDDVQDMLFTVYGMAACLGFPADLDFEQVCASQYTKFDNCIEDTIRTKEKYLAQGIETYYKEQTKQDGTKVYVTYSSHDQISLTGQIFPANKWLKSTRFKEPEYVDLVDLP